eukprot:3869411-Alexandrium_andersonii.AAC.1
MGSPNMVTSRSILQLRRPHGLFGKFVRLAACLHAACLQSTSLAASGRKSVSSHEQCKLPWEQGVGCKLQPQAHRYGARLRAA